MYINTELEYLVTHSYISQLVLMDCAGVIMPLETILMKRDREKIETRRGRKKNVICIILLGEQHKLRRLKIQTQLQELLFFP